jgi:hypothetical protein
VASILLTERRSRSFLAKSSALRSTLPTQGPVHNVKLESGGAQLGMTTGGSRSAGLERHRRLDPRRTLHNMRALFPMYDTPFQAIVLQQSGITSFEQLDNKRIGVGPRAGTGGTYIPEIMKVLGISVEIRYGSPTIWPASFLPVTTMHHDPHRRQFRPSSKRRRRSAYLMRLPPRQIDTLQGHAGVQPVEYPGRDLSPSRQTIPSVHNFHWATQSTRRPRLNCQNHI